MKATKIGRLAIFTVALTFAATGCKTPKPSITQVPTKPTKTTAQTQEVPSTPPVAPEQTPESKDGPIQTTARGSHAGWTENPLVFKDKTVYFEYDSASVKSDEKSKVQLVAALLKNDPASAIRIEGHSDERGTEEYNRSLGERRDLALREELVHNHGIVPERIETVSYGKDRPAVVGHDESAWKQNRRGEFVLLTPPK